MEDITDADYGHAKRIYKDWGEYFRKTFAECYDLYIQVIYYC